jgi:hypothetical protein
MARLTKEKFAFDISGMSDYVNANTTELLSKIVIGSNLAEVVSIFPNIKNAEYVPTFDTGAIDSIAGTGHCNTTFGDITMAEKELRVCDYHINKGYCPEKLASTIMGLRLQPGSYNQTSGAEERFIEDMVAKAAVYTERQFWGSETASGDCTNGILAQIDASGVTGSTVNVTYSAMTPANALEVADTYIQNLPDALRFTPTVLFLNRGDYQSLILALRNANFFAYTVEGQTQMPGAITIPATNVMAVSTEIGTGRALLTYGQNLALGTDLLEDSANAEAWYSQDNKQYRISMQWRVGGTVFFPELVVRIV